MLKKSSTFAGYFELFISQTIKKHEKTLNPMLRYLVRNRILRY